MGGKLTDVLYSVTVEVTGVETMADPEGQTIERALPALGFNGVADVRVGKLITFSLEAGDDETARRQVEEMCNRLLANPVIERATVRLQAAEAAP